MIDICESDDEVVNADKKMDWETGIIATSAGVYVIDREMLRGLPLTVPRMVDLKG